jgi:hypothetical protein
MVSVEPAVEETLDRSKVSADVPELIVQFRAPLRHVSATGAFKCHQVIRINCGKGLLSRSDSNSNCEYKTHAGDSCRAALTLTFNLNEQPQQTWAKILAAW